MTDSTTFVTCSSCHRPLTRDEIRWYEQTCEPCERGAMEETQDWLRGASDPERDAHYSAPDAGAGSDGR